MNRKMSIIILFTLLLATLGVLIPSSAVIEEITITDLGTLGGTFSNAVAINDGGQVVGNSVTSTGENHGFLWTETGGMTDLGLLGASPKKII